MSLLLLLSDIEDNEVIPSYTWATKPAAAGPAIGYKIRISDVGPNGSEWFTNGTDWLPVNGHVLLARGNVAASVTGTVSETVLATVTIPAGLMGTNGQLRVTALWSAGANNANGKNGRIRLGGIGGTLYGNNSLGSNLSAQFQTTIRNVNVANSQKAANTALVNSYGSSTGAIATGAIDTSAAQDLVFSGLLANTGDTMSIESYTVELLR